MNKLIELQKKLINEEPSLKQDDISKLLEYGYTHSELKSICYFSTHEINSHLRNYKNSILDGTIKNK